MGPGGGAATPAARLSPIGEAAVGQIFLKFVTHHLATISGAAVAWLVPRRGGRSLLVYPRLQLVRCKCLSEKSLRLLCTTKQTQVACLRYHSQILNHTSSRRSILTRLNSMSLTVTYRRDIWSILSYKIFKSTWVSYNLEWKAASSTWTSSALMQTRSPPRGTTEASHGEERMD